MSYKTVFSKTDTQTNILEQIRIAFESTANVAATIHGQRKIFKVLLAVELLFSLVKNVVEQYH
jgi:hypothetical protein